MWRTTADGRTVSAKRMTKTERASLVQCIADCRATLDRSTDSSELAYARVGLEECHRELRDRG
jgi:hypothetical protein